MPTSRREHPQIPSLTPPPSSPRDAEMYSLLIDNYIKDAKQKTYLFQAMQNIPCVTKKADIKLFQICDLPGKLLHKLQI